MRMDLVRLGQDYRSSISRIAEQGSIQQSEAIDRVQREASRVSAERLHATAASPPAREAALAAFHRVHERNRQATARLAEATRDGRHSE